MPLNPSATGWHSSLEGSLIREDEYSSLGGEFVELSDSQGHYFVEISFRPTVLNR
jgi:hypothetical protein